jgi:hypothetical protein
MFLVSLAGYYSRRVKYILKEAQKKTDQKILLVLDY